MENPIKLARLSLGLSQSDLVKFSGVSRLVVLRTEQGLYKSPSKQITDPLFSMSGGSFNHETLVGQYKAYQDYTRTAQSWWIKRLEQDRLFRELNEIPPIIHFRKYLSPPVAKSRMGFCRAFCLHPNSQRLFESGQQLTVPWSLVTGLSRAGMTDQTLDRLQNLSILWAREVEGRTGEGSPT